MALATALRHSAQKWKSKIVTEELKGTYDAPRRQKGVNVVTGVTEESSDQIAGAWCRFWFPLLPPCLLSL